MPRYRSPWKPRQLADTRCREASHGEAELKAIGDLIEASEAKWFPFGKEPSAKG
jgi:hypothetical protein